MKSVMNGPASEDKVRWGILSTAHIARKNWKAILNSGNGLVTAVASRDQERSRQFIAECQREARFEPFPEAMGSYEELLASPNVEAVYVPLPTGLRQEWVRRAAAAGKHVVCEKPCARNATELRGTLEVCRQNRAQFMDGVMFMHSRRLDQIRQVLDDGASIGLIKRIGVHFSFCATKEFLRGNIRLHSDLEPHGCLGDLGWYCLRFILWTLQGRLPREVTGRILAQHAGDTSPAPVPTEFSGDLLFDNGVSAAFYCSFLTENQQLAVVSGTKGYLQIPDFVLPFQGDTLGFEVDNTVFELKGCDFEMQARRRRFSIPEHGNSHPTAQESNLFRNFNDQIRSGQLNQQWPEIALKTQILMDACLESARSGRAMKLPG
jgi:predicted dehydrogenase